MAWPCHVDEENTGQVQMIKAGVFLITLIKWQETIVLVDVYVKDFIGDRRQNGRKPFFRMD